MASSLGSFASGVFKKGFPSMNVEVFLRLSQDPQLLNLKAAGHRGQPRQSLATYYHIDSSR